MIDEFFSKGFGERMKADKQAMELKYRKDTSYQDIDLSNKDIAVHCLQQGDIKLSDLVDLITKYPNDQELGGELRKILKVEENS